MTVWILLSGLCVLIVILSAIFDGKLSCIDKGFANLAPQVSANQHGIKTLTTNTQKASKEQDKLFGLLLEQLGIKIDKCEHCRGAGSFKSKAGAPLLYWDNLESYAYPPDIQCCKCKGSGYIVTKKAPVKRTTTKGKK